MAKMKEFLEGIAKLKCIMRELKHFLKPNRNSKVHHEEDEALSEARPQ